MFKHLFSRFVVSNKNIIILTLHQSRNSYSISIFMLELTNNWITNKKFVTQINNTSIILLNASIEIESDSIEIESNLIIEKNISIMFLITLILNILISMLNMLIILLTIIDFLEFTNSISLTTKDFNIERL